MKEFLTKNFLGIVVIILGVLLYLQRCNDDATGIQPPDTSSNTVQVPQPPIIIPIYTPQPSSTQPVINIPPAYKPSEDLATLLAQYNDLARKFLEVKTYKDSIELRDSTGTKVGIVNLNDIVSENSIKSRSPDYQLNFPHTTTIITRTAPPKNQFYIGGAALGNQNQIVTGGKVGIYLKNKRDQLYGLEVQKIKGVPITYGAGMYWKIKL